MDEPPFMIAGWRRLYIIEPDKLRDPPRHCEQCEKRLTIGHLLWNALTKHHLLVCCECGGLVIPGYDGAEAERQVLDYLDKELLFLTPRLWRPVKGTKHDRERWVTIGGLKWLVTVWRESTKAFRVTLTSERDPEVKATSPDKAATIELGKRLAFRVVNRLRSVIRDSGCNEPTGETLDGVEG